MKAQQAAQQVDRLAQTERLGQNLARYYTVPVSVVLELGSYAIVRRGDGLSFVVERIDLEEGH